MGNAYHTMLLLSNTLLSMLYSSILSLSPSLCDSCINSQFTISASSPITEFEKRQLTYHHLPIHLNLLHETYSAGDSLTEETSIDGVGASYIVNVDCEKIHKKRGKAAFALLFR